MILMVSTVLKVLWVKQCTLDSVLDVSDFDFRPLLAPIFSKAIEKQFIQKLDPEGAIKAAGDSLSSLSPSSLPSPPASMLSLTSTSPVSPPLSLLDYPPLALITNNILTALNEIRLVCPLSSSGLVIRSVQELLGKLTKTMLDYHTTSKTSLSSADNEGWGHLCLAVKNILLPYIKIALNAVFR